MDRIKGEGNEQQSDRAEKHHQNRLDLDRFEVQKVRLLIKNASWLHLELCFLRKRGAHFQKIMEKNGRRVKNWAGRPSMAGVMGICGSLLVPKNLER